MKISFSKILWSLFITSIFNICAISPAIAGGNNVATPKLLYKTGYYIGGAALYNSIGGDFDGNRYFVKESGQRETVIIPKIDGDLGLGILIGRRFSYISTELSYLRSVHDGRWNDYTGGVVYNAINLNVKVHFMTDKKAQPHLLAGLSLPWVRINGGAVTSTSKGDAVLYGSGINTGIGFTYYIRDKIFISQDFYWRWVSYNYAAGKVANDDVSDDTLNGNGFTAVVALSFIIN